ncbi:MAG TPA: DUF5106 domain-containing protein [Chitinophagaceae bacterium]|nr:DUF5106 domain-containing protein [Chitinophagaceae bacterium]HRX94105.1 DUF5106 domain-containing protein [Chitinophagaceae bacterium]
MYKKGFLLVTLFISVLAAAQSGYSIEVKLKNSPRKQLFLAYYYGDSQYIKDTADVVNNTAVFKGKQPLEYGIYLVVEPGTNKYMEILIDGKDQNFYLEIDYTAVQRWVDVQGSAVNQQFKSYLEFLNGKRKEREALEKQKEEESIKKLDKEVESYQLNFTKDHRGSLLAAMIKAGQPLDPPSFSGSKEQKDLKNWQWYKAHFFDNIDLKDERMLRTNIMSRKVDEYIDKMTSPHPDSIIRSVDLILKKVSPSKENFKYFLVHLLNKYASSKYVGMDAIYVHIVKEYYAKNKAPWTNKQTLTKILNTAKNLEPLLIGKKAPDLQLTSVNDININLHKFSAKHTILYFYEHDCNSCKKDFPILKKIADKYAAKGLKVLTVCVDYYFNISDIVFLSGIGFGEFRTFIKDNNMGSFFNAHAQIGELASEKIKSIYSISYVPQLYVLDDKKIIKVKQIGADQLEDMLQKMGL